MAAIVVLAVVCPILCVDAAAPVEFPPAYGPYSGDYVYITEPGRYTLEQNISHIYPVGIIIAAPSVILDGQGHTIEPTPADSTTVGIWISLTDLSGNPVTGVTIRNVSVNDEDYGIYSEGIDSSIFPWGEDHSGDTDAQTAATTTRNNILSGISIRTCHEGITLSNRSETKITNSIITDCSGSGITVLGSRAEIRESYIMNNLESGIIIRRSSGSEIVSSTIEGNGKAGVSLEEVNGVQIVNNRFHNTQDVEEDDQSYDVVISPPLDTEDLSDRVYPYDDRETGAVTSQPTTESVVLNLTPEVTVSPKNTPMQDTTPQTFITGIHAVISGDSIPEKMKAGSTYPVELTLVNDGSDDWISQYHQVGVMALEDTAGYGPSWVEIPQGVQVKSGQSQTLSFDIRAPSKPGTYILKYQAARQGTGVQVLFGRAYTKTVTVT